ncbi:MAG: aldose 1-epimerase family protein [Bacteroidia bacterium]
MQLSNGIITAEVQVAGAELTELAALGSSNCLWTPDPVYWNRVAPLLFPIVGRLKQDQMTIGGTSYGMRQHGFARDCDFDLRIQNEHRLVLGLNDSVQTREQFPFSFDLEVEYRLEAERIWVVYRVQNSGPVTLPFSIGAHPGFALQGGLSGHQLEFDKALHADRHLIHEGLYTGETQACLTHQNTLDLDSADFEHDAIVLKHSGLACVRLQGPNGPIAELGLRDAADFPYWGFWTKPGAPFFCLEPWAGLADSTLASGEFMEKEGLVLLQAGAMREFAYWIRPF